MKGMILAAGFGTRMLPLTRFLPKALLPVAGRTLLEWNLRFLAGSGIEEVAVNAHHLAGAVRNEVEKTAGRPGLPRVRLFLEPEILGTAGGIAGAASCLDSDPVVIMNVDLLFRPDLTPALASCGQRGFLAVLLCVEDPLHAQIALEGDQVSAIHHRPVVGEPRLLAFTGVYLLSAEAIRLLTARGPGYREIIPEFRSWMAQGRLGGVRVDGAPFREAGSPEAYLRLVRDIDGELRQALLGSEAARREDSAPAGPAPERYGFISPGAVAEKGARIEESAILDGAVLGPGAIVRRCLLGSGAVVTGPMERAVTAGGESRAIRIPSREEEEDLLAFLRRSRGSAGEDLAVPTAAFLLLKGDGSSRAIFRVLAEGKSRILVRTPRASAEEEAVYPRRAGSGVPEETATFVYVAGHLRSLGVRVPAVLASEEKEGMLLLEDLGDTLLFDLAASRGREEAEVLDLYDQAVDLLLRMQSPPPVAFDPLRTHNIPYDVSFILARESGYFHRWMVRELCRLEVEWEQIEPEYTGLAHLALDGAAAGFMHRDYQSRNLMVTPQGLAVIDFQGARLGPPEYDLASLLYDPYTDLPPALRDRLHERWWRGSGNLSRAPAARESDVRYRASAINRTLQALGAYAWLGGHRKKPGFLEHAPAALRHLVELCRPEFPRLADLARRTQEALTRRGEEPRP